MSRSIHNNPPDNNTPLHMAALSQNPEDLNAVLNLLFHPTDIRNHAITQEMFEIICDTAMRDVVHLRTLSQQQLLIPINPINIQNRHGDTPWDYAILSHSIDCVKIFLAAGAPINARAYEIAGHLPYTLATLRLYEISDRHQGLEQGRAAFIQAFIEHLFNPDMDFQDKGNEHYAFLVLSIEAEIFTPADIARAIEAGPLRQPQQLRAALAQTSANANPDIFYFLKEVSEALPLPRTLLLSRSRQQPQTTQNPSQTTKHCKIN